MSYYVRSMSVAYFCHNGRRAIVLFLNTVDEEYPTRLPKLAALHHRSKDRLIQTNLASTLNGTNWWQGWMIAADTYNVHHAGWFKFKYLDDKMGEWEKSDSSFVYESYDISHDFVSANLSTTFVTL